jgi:alkylation response protein AidB-like acyl-CoA dehydrogenase
MLAGSEVWCQLFSEPGAGSDLASLTTRAERDGEEYVVNGSKIWTTHGHLSDFGLLLARTNGEVAKHKGISCMICPMDTQGVSLQPIYNMEGEHKWNMVFFDDVHLPIENLIGEENDGWRVARVVLSNERMSMSSADGLAWGSGPSYLDLLVIARQLNKESPLLPGIREELASGWIKALSLHVMRTQALGRINHEQKGDVIPEVRRTLADEHGQAMIELWRDLYGPAGMALFPGSSEREINFAENYFYARALTLGGGTGQIQRNILAERILGLPR